MQAEPRPLPSLPPSAGLRKQQQQQQQRETKEEKETEEEKQRELTTLKPPEPSSSPASLPSAAAAPPAAHTCKVEPVAGQRGVVVEGVEEVEEDRQRNVNVEARKTPFWMDDDDLPPMM